MLPQVCQLQGLVWIHPQVSYSDKHEARFELLANAHKGPPPTPQGTALVRLTCLQGHLAGLSLADSHRQSAL